MARFPATDPFSGGRAITPASVSFTRQPAAGGPTLDALMRRQRELAERSQSLATEEYPGYGTIAGGLGNMLNQFTTGRAERQAEEQETTARAQLAQLISGFDPEGTGAQQAIGQISALDPDLSITLLGQLAQSRRDKAAAEAAIANREDLQTFQAGQQTEQQTFTAGQNELTRKAAADKAAAEAALAAQKPLSSVAQIKADLAAGRMLPEEADLAIKKATSIPQVGGTAADRKALWDTQDAYLNTEATLNQLKRASGLLSQGINTGYTAGAKTMFDKSGLPIGTDPETAKRTDDYNSIMNQEAIMAMSQALKGATTDTEMAAFIRDMNNPTIDPTVKQKQIDAMVAKAQAFNELRGQRIKALDPTAELPTVGAADTAGAAAGEEKLLQDARDAIAKGANADLVRKRLVDKGVDPGKL